MTDWAIVGQSDKQTNANIQAIENNLKKHVLVVPQQLPEQLHQEAEVDVVVALFDVNGHKIHFVVAACIAIAGVVAVATATAAAAAAAATVAGLASGPRQTAFGLDICIRIGGRTQCLSKLTELCVNLVISHHTGPKARALSEVPASKTEWGTQQTSKLAD